MTGADKKMTDSGNNLQLLPLIVQNIPQAIFWKDKDPACFGCNRGFMEV